MPNSQRTVRLERTPLELRVGWWLLAAALLTVPIAFDQRVKDTFRLPKELLFDACGILAAVCLVFIATAKNRPTLKFSRVRAAAVVSVLIALWTCVTAAASENRFLAWHTVVTVGSSLAIFWLAICVATASRSLKLFDIAMVGALVNAVLASLQDFGVWQPFSFPPEMDGRIRTTGLAGNPNDIGIILLLPGVATVAATFVFSGRRRLFYGAMAMVILGGLIVCRSRTTLIAYGFALLLSLIGTRLKYALAIVLLVALATFAVLSGKLQEGRGHTDLMKWIREGNLQLVFSERMPAYLTAIEMARDHPLMGVGPGVYKWQYMHYRVRLPARYPPLWLEGRPLNFREAHNDHLQVLAETGVVGYALFLAAFMLLSPPRLEFAGHVTAILARRLRVPLAGAIFTSMLAQFPLQLAAGRLLIIYFCALVLAWDDTE